MEYGCFKESGHYPTELLKTLNEKIELETPPEDISQTKFIEIMYDIWRLIEYRNHLDRDNEIEKEWLEENKQEIISRVQEKIDVLNSDEKNFIFDIINERISISKDEIVAYMNVKMELENVTL